jgi:hypothetical protein
VHGWYWWVTTLQSRGHVILLSAGCDAADKEPTGCNHPAALSQLCEMWGRGCGCGHSQPYGAFSCLASPCSISLLCFLVTERFMPCAAANNTRRPLQGAPGVLRSPHCAAAASNQLPPGHAHDSKNATNMVMLHPEVATMPITTNCTSSPLVAAYFAGHYRVHPECFGHLTALLRPLAPLGLLLEGGYNLAASAASAEACVRALLGERPAPLRGTRWV